MSTPDRSSAPRFDPADEALLGYRALSSLAVAGLLAGLLSPLVLLSVWWWPAPVAAVVLSGLALRRMATNRPDLVGRPAALAGLLLGAAFLVAAPVDDFVYRYFFRREARQFAQVWFDIVSHGGTYKVYKAHCLTLPAKQRWPLDSNLATFYLQNKSRQMLLTDFVKQPAIRTLFALGTKAKVRFYETVAEEGDAVKQIYAVTYPDEQQRPTSFFVTLVMQRTVDAGTGRADWTLANVVGGTRPEGW
jgi:hypothetical protein